MKKTFLGTHFWCSWLHLGHIYKFWGMRYREIFFLKKNAFEKGNFAKFEKSVLPVLSGLSCLYTVCFGQKRILECCFVYKTINA